MAYNELLLKCFTVVIIFLEYQIVSSWDDSGCYDTCGLPACDISCLGAKAYTKCPSGSCSSKVCCTGQHMAHADCTGCFCESTCQGNACSTRCSGVSCLSTCHGPRCFAECLGNNCKATCYGENCSTACLGGDCDAECNGKWCRYSKVVNLLRDPDFGVKNHADVHKKMVLKLRKNLKQPKNETKNNKNDNKNNKNENKTNNNDNKNKNMMTTTQKRPPKAKKQNNKKKGFLDMTAIRLGHGGVKSSTVHAK